MLSGIDRTSDFELIQITGTLNGGTGSYTDYQGNATPALAEDSFIIVNKVYRIYTTVDANQFDFVVTITGTDGDPAITPSTSSVHSNFYIITYSR